MGDDRNRPQGGKPDTAALIQKLFRDEPEEARPADPAEGGGEGTASSVGVVTPPDAGGEVLEQGERAEGPVTQADDVVATAEGVVEAPPGLEDQPAGARDGRAWFVIHTYSGYENKVRTNLERRVASMAMGEKIFRVLVPTEDEIEVKDGKRRIAKKKVFPGYVLVEMLMDDDSWYVVRNTPGVTGFVGSGSKPLPLQDREVKAILRQLGDETPKFRITYQKGSSVRINSGPFMDFSGIVDEILPEKEKVRVLVSIFGRETPVELDFAQVEKI
jgi:transcription termination/antitermination protein NusG